MNIDDIGFQAIEKDDCQEALNIFKRSMESGKTARNFYGYGLASLKLHDLPAARWAFYKALELDPAHRECNRLVEEIERMKVVPPSPERTSVFRAGAGYLERKEEGGWKRVFIKGMNLGLALPGFFPGEYPIRKGAYLKWFHQMAELGVNSVRTYTVHPPGFYEALHEFNKSSGKKIYLFQGIWVELPDSMEFNGPDFSGSVRKDIRNAVDAVFGNASLPERPGYASGEYAFDVSRWTAGFIFGREWESCAVKGFNRSAENGKKSYSGAFLSIADASPMEAWLARMCDYVQEYEHDSYGTTRPVSTVSWPTLDSLEHPSESRYEDERLFFHGDRETAAVCNENEDAESLDLSRIKTESGGGFFATYHVYPYYPDFLNNDYLDRDEPYLAYLQDLRKKHGDQPVLIAEFGVPTNRDPAHWHAKGWNQGGHDERRKGEIEGEIIKTIHRSGMAGGMVFSWFDEWFKRNWLFLPYELPAERNPLWFNLQDAEQNFGYLGTYPGYPGKIVRLSCDRSDWPSRSRLYEKGEGRRASFNDGSDRSRTLKALYARSDEGFLYVMLETYQKIDFETARYLIGLDTCDPEKGEFKLPYATGLFSPIGLKFLISINGREGSRILACQSYDKRLNAGKGTIRPVASRDGAWVVMQNMVNTRRFSKDGKRFFPPRFFTMSSLKFGSLDPGNPDHNTAADFYFKENMIEVRLPWGLINFTDPSSRTVLWKDGGSVTRKTDGVNIIAATFKPEKGGVAALATGLADSATDTLPEQFVAGRVKKHTWDAWETPVYHTYRKESFSEYKKALSEIPEYI